MSLIDLNELILQCRSSQARTYLSEAVASYNASAFRSSIIATWHSVVFDFLHKLRELELSGDKQAKAKLAEFESIRAGGDSTLGKALKFEREILASAENDFELLTPTEKLDLDRLQEDRNRCAHPSMQSAEEPYQPSAELARSHIRNAVEYLLRREPVQGKAAFEKIVSEIKSPYFPKSVVLARQHFEAGPLRRASKPLVRSLVIGLCKSLLKDNTPPDERARQLAAVGAILDMHRSDAEEAVKQDLPSMMAGVDPVDLWKLIALCRAFPLAWDAAGPATQGTCERYLSSVTDPASKPKAIAAAFGVPVLKSMAMQRLNQLTVAELGDAIAEQPVTEFVVIAIEKLSEAESYRQAESLMERLVCPLTPILDPSNIDQLLVKAAGNSQIWDAAGVREMLFKMFNDTVNLHSECRQAWLVFRSSIRERSLQNWNTYYANLNAAMVTSGMLVE